MSNRHDFIREVADIVSLHFRDIPIDKLERITKCLIFRKGHFSYELVQSYQRLCLRCGKCCFESCIDFNKETGLCKGYATRPKECAEWPYWKIEDEEGIYCDLDCNYSFRLVVNEVIRYIEGLDEIPDVPETKETFII